MDPDAHRRTPPISRRQLLRGTVLAAAAASSVSARPAPGLAAARPGPARNPAEVLRDLLEGNKRFVSGHTTAPRRQPDDFAALSASQSPEAVIVGCADSRVPPEIVFDQGVGDLFVVRVAGNVVTPEGLGSLEYGTLVLGARVLVVLGHSRCGAVEAALAGAPVPGQISTLFQHIAPGLDGAKTDLGAAIEDNVRRQVKTVVAGSPVITDLVRRDRLLVQGAVYDLDTGAVRVLG
jgi:carbonic anhydrase